MKKGIFLLLFIVWLVLGCKNSSIEDKVYNLYFADLADVIIPIDGSSIVFTQDDVNEMKNEIKDIKYIKKYEANSNPGSIFKNYNYYLILLVTKEQKTKGEYYQALYSTKEKIMILKKEDIQEETINNYSRIITVFEFKIPEKVNRLLKKYENPYNERDFYLSWND